MNQIPPTKPLHPPFGNRRLERERVCINSSSSIALFVGGGGGGDRLLFRRWGGGGSTCDMPCKHGWANERTSGRMDAETTVKRAFHKRCSLKFGILVPFPLMRIWPLQIQLRIYATLPLHYSLCNPSHQLKLHLWLTPKRNQSARFLSTILPPPFSTKLQSDFYAYDPYAEVKVSVWFSKVVKDYG